MGIDIPSDGGALNRLCAKMATGSGKTVVMAMVIAWHVLNRVANPRDVRFAKNILVVAPGLTLRSRLAVLKPSDPENYYEQFRVVPPALLDKLRRSPQRLARPSRSSGRRFVGRPQRTSPSAAA